MSEPSEFGFLDDLPTSGASQPAPEETAPVKTSRKKSKKSSQTTQVGTPPEAPESLQDGQKPETPQEPSEEPLEAPAAAGSEDSGESPESDPEVLADDAPEPTQPDPTPATEPKQAPLRVLGVGEDLTLELFQKWDDMMTAFSKNTRIAVWEKASDMQQLLLLSKDELTRGHGKLNSEQLAEVEAAVAKFGFKFSEKRQEGVRKLPNPQLIPTNVVASDTANGRVLDRVAKMQQLRNCR